VSAHPQRVKAATPGLAVRTTTPLSASAAHRHMRRALACALGRRTFAITRFMRRTTEPNRWLSPSRAGGLWVEVFAPRWQSRPAVPRPRAPPALHSQPHQATISALARPAPRERSPARDAHTVLSTSSCARSSAAASTSVGATLEDPPLERTRRHPSAPHRSEFRCRRPKRPYGHPGSRRT
jgi:hypothetical protein